MNARLAAALLLCCFTASALGAPGINKSRHDFAQKSYGTWAKGQICLPCHIPHNATVKAADGSVIDGPLWNHTLSSATYLMYSPLAPKMVNGQPVLTGAVDTNSMLCLSCHDGTVALDSFGGGAGTMPPLYGLSNLTDDLTDDHPIGETAAWPTTTPPYMVDPALRDAQHIMPLRYMSDGVTKAVGCTSCHEPHNRTGYDRMLWVNNTGPQTTVDGRNVTGSALCMNCHKK